MTARPSQPAGGYLSKSEAARYAGLSQRTLDAARASGALPYYRFGARKVLFRRSDLEAWLEPLRVDVSAGARP